MKNRAQHKVAQMTHRVGKENCVCWDWIKVSQMTPLYTTIMHRQKLFYFCFILIKTHLKILRLLRCNKNHYHYHYHQ